MGRELFPVGYTGFANLEGAHTIKVEHAAGMFAQARSQIRQARNYRKCGCKRCKLEVGYHLRKARMVNRRALTFHRHAAQNAGISYREALEQARLLKAR